MNSLHDSFQFNIINYHMLFYSFVKTCALFWHLLLIFINNYILPLLFVDYVTCNITLFGFMQQIGIQLEIKQLDINSCYDHSMPYHENSGYKDGLLICWRVHVCIDPSVYQSPSIQPELSDHMWPYYISCQFDQTRYKWLLIIDYLKISLYSLNAKHIF